MLSLRPKDRERIRSLIRKYHPNVDIIAYGSRVKGTNHDASDLDLALRSPDGKPLPIRPFSDLLEAICESNIPIIVEIRDWARLPESFRKEIENQHELL